MDLSNLPDDLKQRVRACESEDELRALAEQEGIELSDEQLAAIAGGTDWSCLTLKWECDGYSPSDPI